MIKEIRNIETNELTGYLFEGMSVPLANGNRHYEEIKKLISEGEEVQPAFSEEERNEFLENKRIQGIKSKAQSIILEKYPLAKQSSAQLGLYGDEYLEEMKTFISSIIEISNTAEQAGTKLEEIIWQ